MECDFRQALEACRDFSGCLEKFAESLRNGQSRSGTGRAEQPGAGELLTQEHRARLEEEARRLAAGAGALFSQLSQASVHFQSVASHSNVTTPAAGGEEAPAAKVVVKPEDLDTAAAEVVKKGVEEVPLAAASASAALQHALSPETAKAAAAAGSLAAADLVGTQEIHLLLEQLDAVNGTIRLFDEMIAKGSLTPASLITPASLTGAEPPGEAAPGDAAMEGLPAARLAAASRDEVCAPAAAPPPPELGSAQQEAIVVPEESQPIPSAAAAAASNEAKANSPEAETMPAVIPQLLQLQAELPAHGQAVASAMQLEAITVSAAARLADAEDTSQIASMLLATAPQPSLEGRREPSLRLAARSEDPRSPQAQKRTRSPSSPLPPPLQHAERREDDGEDVVVQVLEEAPLLREQEQPPEVQEDLVREVPQREATHPLSLLQQPQPPPGDEEEHDIAEPEVIHDEEQASVSHSDARHPNAIEVAAEQEGPARAGTVSEPQHLVVVAAPAVAEDVAHSAFALPCARDVRSPGRSGAGGKPPRSAVVRSGFAVPALPSSRRPRAGSIAHMYARRPQPEAPDSDVIEPFSQDVPAQPVGSFDAIEPCSGTQALVCHEEPVEDVADADAEKAEVSEREEEEEGKKDAELKWPEAAAVGADEVEEVKEECLQQHSRALGAVQTPEAAQPHSPVCIDAGAASSQKHAQARGQGPPQGRQLDADFDDVCRPLKKGSGKPDSLARRRLGQVSTVGEEENCPENANVLTAAPARRISATAAKVLDVAAEDDSDSEGGDVTIIKTSKPSMEKPSKSRSRRRERERSRSEPRAEAAAQTPAAATGPSAAGPMILFSGFAKGDVLRHKRSIQRLGGVVVGSLPLETDSASQVRVVVRSSPAKSGGGREKRCIAASRTLKYLDAVLSGAWIVPVEWVLSSISSNRFLPEADFELAGDPCTLGGPMRGRDHGQSLFQGLRMFFVGLNAGTAHSSGAIARASTAAQTDLEDTGPSAADLQHLARRGGAEVVSRIELLPEDSSDPPHLAEEIRHSMRPDGRQRNRKRRKVGEPPPPYWWRRPVAVIPSRAAPAANDMAAMLQLGWTVLPSGWMLDCISSGEILQPVPVSTNVVDIGAPQQAHAPLSSTSKRMRA
mmetsp:Transcript_31151/g.72553  ORF Transcript_31151/g.72553 Transcript_31151/m.72553 type:complete len:1134 (+) Transcript_31151:97-3498(+)